MGCPYTMPDCPGGSRRAGSAATGGRRMAWAETCFFTISGRLNRDEAPCNGLFRKKYAGKARVGLFTILIRKMRSRRLMGAPRQLSARQCGDACMVHTPPSWKPDSDVGFLRGVQRTPAHADSDCGTARNAAAIMARGL